MGVRIEYSQVIDRSVDQVFRFIADDHVRNHPRWDSDIELWLDAERPIQLGTIIRRRNTRSGRSVEGTMRVVEFERNQSFATLIQDGPVTILGKVEFEALSPEKTRVNMLIEFPDTDESMDRTIIEDRLRATGKIRKRLIEDEV